MPVTTSYPGIYIEELPTSTRTIAAAPTSITVFIGYTHPFKTKTFAKPIRIFSFSDYEREFGGLYRHERLDNSVAYAVQQFFLNGGSDAYVIGLQPRFYKLEGVPTYQRDFVQTQATIGTSIVLEARDPTDVLSPMTVAVRQKGSATVADITIAYGSRVEVYRDVTLDSNDTANFIEVRLAGSALVELVEVSDYGSFTEGTKTFDYATGEAPAPDWTTFAAADFEVFDDGDLLDKVDIFNLMAIPGVSDTSILSKALVFCENKKAFLIVDPPANHTVDDIASADTLDIIPKSTNGALYFPYITSLDSLTGSTISLPPSGTVAGIFAKTDTNRGVWKAPAGLETTLRNVTGVVVDGRMTDNRRAC